MSFLSLALQIGIILASFTISGTCPAASELFIIVEMGNARYIFRSLTNLVDIPSWPLLAFDFKLLIIVRMSAGVIGLKNGESLWFHIK